MRKPRYRSRLGIVVNILEVLASGEEKPTRIMYGTNLSYDRLQRYLASLVEMGLVEEVRVEEGVRYRITRQGLDFLSEAKRIVEFMRAFGFEV